MNCGGYRDAIDACFDAGEAGDAATMAHAAACPACAAYGHALGELSGALDALPGEFAPVGLESRLCTALARERRRAWWLRAASCAAALLLAVSLGFVYPVSAGPETFEDWIARGLETPTWLNSMQVPVSSLITHEHWVTEWRTSLEALALEWKAWTQAATPATTWLTWPLMAAALAMLAGMNAVAARRVNERMR